MNVQSHRRAIAEMNVVPYIDVMLVLLVIFMVTTPLFIQGVNVTLPKASAKALTIDDQMPIIVSVDRQGRYYLNVSKAPKNPLSSQKIQIQVAAQLRLAQQRKQHRAVLVKGDAQVDYAHVVEAMVFLQKAGAVNIGLMTAGTDITRTNAAIKMAQAGEKQHA